MSRRMASLIAVAAIATGVLGLSACAPEPVTPAPTAQPTPTSTPSPTQTPTPEPTQEPTPEAWERFTDPRMSQSFEVPPDWTVQEIGSPNDMGIVQFGVMDESGAQRLFFANTVQGLGGACGDLPVQAVEELDARPVDIPGYVAAPDDGTTQLVAPRVVFRAAPVAEGAIASLALADDVPPESCMYYNLLHTADGLTAFGTRLQVDTYDPQAQWLFGSVDEARAYTQTEDYAKLVRILSSLRVS